MTRKEVDRGNEEEAQKGRQEQAGLLDLGGNHMLAMMPTLEDVRRGELLKYAESKRIAVLLARSLARRRVVTDGRVAASLELYESALERAKP